MRQIIAVHLPPPIPSRAYDWQASREGWDIGDPIGYGQTKEAAIADLLEQEEEKETNNQK